MLAWKDIDVVREAMWLASVWNEMGCSSLIAALLGLRHPKRLSSAGVLLARAGGFL